MPCNYPKEGKSMRDESAAEKKRHEGKGYREYYKKYSSKEARAGHRYDISPKHREREAMGMKHAMEKKYPGSEHHGMHKPMRHNPGY